MNVEAKDGPGPRRRWVADYERPYSSAYSITSGLAPLFRPVKFGPLVLRNRFVMAPMTRSFAPGGIPGSAMTDYYRRRAEGEVGLIITEGIGVPHPAAIGYSGVDVPDIPVIGDERSIAGWKRVVQAVHAADGVIIPQLWHQGGMRVQGTGPRPDAPSLRPSGIWGPASGALLVPESYVRTVRAETRPMTDREIGDVLEAFVRAARIAKDIGFDGIAIHAAHGYLIDSFLWDVTNRRTDQWGGDPLRRSRFAAEIVRAVREVIGALMPIVFRFSQWKLQDGTAYLADSPNILAALLEPIADAGADIFDVSTRSFDAPAFAGSPLSLAGWTRALTGQPTIAVGGVGLAHGLFEKGGARPSFRDNLGRLAERFADREFDLAAVGRMLIAEPDWVRRIRDGLPFRGYSVDQLDTLF